MAECLVCGEPARSAEHVMPQWLTRMIGEKEVLTEQAEEVAEDGSVRRLEDRTTTTMARKTVKICAPCNTGWMSDMESRAKPYLEKLAEGEPGWIHDDVAALLLAWSLKTGVIAMASSTHPLDRSLARSLLQGLRDMRVPRNAFLRIGWSPLDELVATPVSTMPLATTDRDAGLQALIVVGPAILRVGWVAPGVHATAASLIQEDDGLVQAFPPSAQPTFWASGRWALGDPQLPHVRLAATEGEI